MKTKIGGKLKNLREDRKLSQDEFAKMLDVSTSAYARMERNETSPDLSQILRWTEVLNVPLSEFLPENITFQANNDNGNVGIVLGNVNYYNDQDTAIKDVQADNDRLTLEVRFLQDKITLLESQLADYRKILKLQDE